MKVIKFNDPLELAREKQVTIAVNGNVYHIMCTPENLEELVLGFLISEGLASSSDEIKIYDASFSSTDTIVVELKEATPILKLRSSGCIGVFREKEKLSRIVAEENFNLDEIRESLDYLEIEEYRMTRGYHIAALIDKKGLVARAHDVGRHNAVDKAIGMGIKKRVNFRRTFLLISGRISQGMTLKCVRTGIPLLVSKAAILDSAIDVCLKTGLSAVSFVTGIAVKGDALSI
jgi:FdhD protein